MAQLVKNTPAMRETWVQFLSWEDPLEGKSYPLQYSGLENFMDSPWGCKESNMTEQLSLGASLIAQLVKNLPAIWETQIQEQGEN